MPSQSAAVSLPHRREAKGTPPLPHHDRPWTLRCTPGNTVVLPVLADERAGNSKTPIVVPVFDPVPVAIGRAEVPRFVVPRTATQHALRRDDQASKADRTTRLERSHGATAMYWHNHARPSGPTRRENESATPAPGRFRASGHRLQRVAVDCHLRSRFPSLSDVVCRSQPVRLTSGAGPSRIAATRNGRVVSMPWPEKSPGGRSPPGPPRR